MSTLVIFLFSLGFGYYVFLILTHPQKKKHRLPRICYRNIEIMPNIRVHFGSKTYHLHHWLVLSVLTVGTLFVFEGFRELMVLKGAAIGGILQGLRYPDRFKFRHSRYSPAEVLRK